MQMKSSLIRFRRDLLYFFTPTRNRLVISLAIFVFLIINFFTFSGVVIENCGFPVEQNIDLCLEAQQVQRGEAFSHVVRLSYLFSLLSFPIIMLFPQIYFTEGINTNPMVLWLIALTFNILYSYLISCILVSFYERYATGEKKRIKKRKNHVH